MILWARSHIIPQSLRQAGKFHDDQRAALIEPTIHLLGCRLPGDDQQLLALADQAQIGCRRCRDKGRNPRDLPYRHALFLKLFQDVMDRGVNAHVALDRHGHLTPGGIIAPYLFEKLAIGIPGRCPIRTHRQVETGNLRRINPQRLD